MEYKANGKITALVGGLYTVALDSGDTPLSGQNVSCRARGAFRHSGESPLVGDRVAVVWNDSGDSSGIAIDEIIDRKNSLIRPPLANLDMLFVTLSSAKPEPSVFTADKLISICEFNGIEPCIVIGKCELDGKRAEEIEKIYTLAGYRVFVLSCFCDIGIEPLRAYIESVLPGKTIAFAGASGAGKSTLLNKLFPNLELTTGDVSHKTQRGRHTTRTVNLFPVCGGYVADTPGFSMIDFERFDFFSKEDLPGTFKEFEDCIGECKYTKCTHTKEEGCAVLQKLNDGKIAPSRHESFLALYDILKQKHGWDTK